jgi:hypothetical protein
METSADAERPWPILSRRAALAAGALTAINPLPASAGFFGLGEAEAPAAAPQPFLAPLTGDKLMRAGIYQREIIMATDGLQDLQFLLRGSADAKRDIRDALRLKPVNKLRNASYKLWKLWPEDSELGKKSGDIYARMVVLLEKFDQACSDRNEEPVPTEELQADLKELYTSATSLYSLMDMDF